MKTREFLEIIAAAVVQKSESSASIPLTPREQNLAIIEILLDEEAKATPKFLTEN